MLRIENILCPVDFSEFSSRALHHAGALAYKHGARLTVLHVVPNRPFTDLPLPALTDDERRQLTDQVRRFGADLPAEVSPDILVREAPVVSREILSQAKAIPADLLVIGSHGRSGFERFLLGSVTEKVMRRAPCPTLVVPRRAEDVMVDEPVRFRRILCSIDFSPSSTHALQYARSMVDEEGGQVVLLHAIEVPPELRANPLVEEYDVAKVRAAAEADGLRRLQQLVPEVPPWCNVKTLVREGAAYREILRVAGEGSADPIVMGVQGRGAMDLLAFGSNTARVSRGAALPVLIVPCTHQVKEP
jgi:nucleotide-binding universal stress UspA family protein